MTEIKTERRFLRVCLRCLFAVESFKRRNRAIITESINADTAKYNNCRRKNVISSINSFATFNPTKPAVTSIPPKALHVIFDIVEYTGFSFIHFSIATAAVHNHLSMTLKICTVVLKANPTYIIKSAMGKNVTKMNNFIL